MENIQMIQSYTPIEVNTKNILVAQLENGYTTAIEKCPHPWHINLSAEDSDKKAVYNKLKELHIRGDIQVGDIITGLKTSALSNINYMANIFAGEYESKVDIDPNGQIKQTLTRVSPVINANISQKIPNSHQELESRLSHHGHILLRAEKSIADTHILKLLAEDGKAINYRYGNVVRKQLKNSKALHVTHWAKDLIIPAHNEMSYHLTFPKNVAFVCREPAEYGGETSIYDCAKAFENLSPSLQKKVLTQNVISSKRYVKQTDHSRYPSWQQVLGTAATTTKALKHFTSIGFDCEQRQEEEQGEMIDVIQINLVCPMVYTYQGKQCLHTTMVSLTPYWYAQTWPDKTPPLSVRWEDGSPFSYEEFYELDEAILLSRIRYGGWRSNDILILDNIRVAHGRQPFIGKRLIGVLMAQPTKFTYKNKKWEVDFLSTKG